jgi:hypothetical protein
MSLSDFIGHKTDSNKKTSNSQVEDLFVIPKLSTNTNIIDSDLHL